MKITKNKTIFIKEQEYQKMKRELDKKNNYFSREEIQKYIQNTNKNNKRKHL